MNDRLYRSRADRMIAGVAGGLAQSMRLDPSIVRVIWAILVPATGGLALVVYIVMAIVVQPTVGVISDYTASRWGRRKPYIVIGALLALIPGLPLIQVRMPVPSASGIASVCSLRISPKISLSDAPVASVVTSALKFQAASPGFSLTKEKGE